MENVVVYSPIEDKNIQKNLNDSPIWKQAYHEEELQGKNFKEVFKYSMKFDGLKPFQVTKVEKHK
jgi:hypothetical protein